MTNVNVVIDVAVDVLLIFYKRGYCDWANGEIYGVHFDIRPLSVALHMVSCIYYSVPFPDDVLCCKYCLLHYIIISLVVFPCYLLLCQWKDSVVSVTAAASLLSWLHR